MSAAAPPEFTVMGQTQLHDLEGVRIVLAQIVARRLRQRNTLPCRRELQQSGRRCAAALLCIDVGQRLAVSLDEAA